MPQQDDTYANAPGTVSLLLVMDFEATCEQNDRKWQHEIIVCTPRSLGKNACTDVDLGQLLREHIAYVPHIDWQTCVFQSPKNRIIVATATWAYALCPVSCVGNSSRRRLGPAGVPRGAVERGDAAACG